MRSTIQFLGYVLVSILGGLLAYQTPPESAAQFWEWVWQPLINGLYVALGASGVNVGVQKLVKEPKP